jgi:transposase
MNRSRRPSNATMLKAIKGSHGIVSVVAKRLGVEWHTANTYIRADEETLQALRDEEEKVSDAAENQLVRKINSGDPWAVKFWLTTKARKRGFVSKAEIAGEIDGEINVTIKHV